MRLIIVLFGKMLEICVDESVNLTVHNCSDVAGFVSGLIVAFDGDAEVAETVSGLILQGASVFGYLVAEGLADAGHTE